MSRVAIAAMAAFVVAASATSADATITEKSVPESGAKKAALVQSAQDQTSFRALVLVCPAGMVPQDCQEDTAIDVIRAPETANEVTCGLYGQAFVAESAIAGGVGQDSYVKISCTRLRAGVAARDAVAQSTDR